MGPRTAMQAQCADLSATSCLKGPATGAIHFSWSDSAQSNTSRCDIRPIWPRRKDGGTLCDGWRRSAGRRANEAVVHPWSMERRWEIRAERSYFTSHVASLFVKSYLSRIILCFTIETHVCIIRRSDFPIINIVKYPRYKYVNQSLNLNFTARQHSRLSRALY